MWNVAYYPRSKCSGRTVGIHIETSMWKIQRMSFMVADPHLYNDFFARVYSLSGCEAPISCFAFRIYHFGSCYLLFHTRQEIQSHEFR